MKVLRGVFEFDVKKKAKLDFDKNKKNTAENRRVFKFLCQVKK